MSDRLKQKKLFENINDDKSQEPVECLGMTFENDEKRREYFLDKLREKLKDPEFRKIEGFPIGEDEDILALSDPPYYTACPNPFIENFVNYYGKPYDSATDNYHREPFASDTGAGKTHPIYTAHPYHSKIPHLATMPCILHYTTPGDIVLDGFSGSGMTGVAAQLCGQPEPIFKSELEEEWKKADFQTPKWGGRYPILIDLSPIATFIAYNLNFEISDSDFSKAAEIFFYKIDKELEWIYETIHSDGIKKGRINYVVWSEVFICPNCVGDIVFIEQAYNPKTNKFEKIFECPSCQSTLMTKNCEHKIKIEFDKSVGKTIKKVTYLPVEIEYMLPGDKTKYRKKPDDKDMETLYRLENVQPKDWYPTDKLLIGKMRDSNHLSERGITHYHHFYLPHALYALSAIWRITEKISNVRVRAFLKFMVDSCFMSMSLANSYRPAGYSQTSQYIKGMYYIPPNNSALSPWYILKGKFKRLQKMLNKSQLPIGNNAIISTSSVLNIPIPNDSIDYIYTDPPFGDAIKYGDLNLLIEAWHRLHTRLENEILWDKLKNKSLSIYSRLMHSAFKEYFRVLKPGRWMTVVFHNSKNLVWTAIQEAIGNAGFVVADVRTLDRQQGSFNQVTSAGAVKHDLVISAYKPNSGLESQFDLVSGTEKSVWDFIRMHLKQLPVFVKNKSGRVEVIVERQNFLLYDRMIAFHVQRGITVPLSASEFYQGLELNFPQRDGMYFHPEQVAEYDKKRLTAKEIVQLQLFVTDESSAIQWLKQRLTKKAQTFQDIHPHFLKEIGGWQKHEKSLELFELLDQNFIKYDGKDDVPSQIHSYLSSNYKYLRNLKKNDPTLKAKAKDRWYVPDPNKAGDLEKLRERSLLKEFEEYRKSKQKRLKVFRFEAVRAGFKKAWQERDYNTIISVAKKIPEKILQEDPKLLMWYDQALTRSDEDQ